MFVFHSASTLLGQGLAEVSDYCAGKGLTNLCNYLTNDNMGDGKEALSVVVPISQTINPMGLSNL